ncbi:MAG: hypothetical protein A2X86_07860 [Bdellovibrionales bacterium GWA2_49_15]|nr:MAG: hypothetical protein A2X86_07860 [Bdellovibrionales bacterium GWA2_49_15]HAZ11806.1 hypothetical protein [Bdellovibrionales bacterium]
MGVFVSSLLEEKSDRRFDNQEQLERSSALPNKRTSNWDFRQDLMRGPSILGRWLNCSKSLQFCPTKASCL